MHGELRLLSIYISDRTKENLGECRVNEILRLLTVSRCSNLLIKSLLSTFSFLWSSSLEIKISWLYRRNFLRQMFVSKTDHHANFYIYQFFNSSEGKFHLTMRHKEIWIGGFLLLVIFLSSSLFKLTQDRWKGGQLGLSAMTYVISPDTWCWLRKFLNNLECITVR